VLAVTRSGREESAADATVVELLQKSPYKDKLGEAGLFLRMIASRATQLPNLIQPHIGDHMSDGGQTRLSELMERAPELAPDSLEQVAALALGARLTLDPWTSRLELLRTAADVASSVREKVPLAVTPLTPYLKYVEVESAAGAAATASVPAAVEPQPGR
jgi:hypothetical protein